ncbi:hypothetical protein GGH94_004785 [Coemansia aciculifera]|uniref:Uncharacterized protein n=1 Tax=Coemansia aciculifera TaxID=417176 RepID=A0A9W8IEP4_9FUNG|nr:hypothetical protein GGH94_004785 [Coemansia aciculifera]
MAPLPDNNPHQKLSLALMLRCTAACVTHPNSEHGSVPVRGKGQVVAGEHHGGQERAKVCSTSQETIEATLATAADGLDDALAALDEWNARRDSYLAKREAAARKAKTFDRVEYYAEQKRNAIYDREREGITIAYEMTIRAAEAAAGPELTRTEAQAADLEAARNSAMDTALRDLDIAHYIAIDEVDAAQRKDAATRAAIRDPNHVHIGGDPGVVTFATFSRFDIRWSYSISAKQYHADSGSTWRAAEMNRLIDRFDLREWISRMPSSKTASSEKTLELLRYLFAKDAFNRYIDMHMMIRVRIIRWRAYEQKRSAIPKYCNKDTAGCTRENMTIDMVLYRPPVARDSLLPGDQAPFPACRPAPVYCTPIHRSDMPLADQALFPACNRVPVYRAHRVCHYAHKPHPTPKPACEPSLRFKHPLPCRSLPQNDQGPFPACARHDPRPPKPQNERSCWMPTAVRAGQLRQAENIREAKEARIRRVANSDMSRLTKQFAHLNLAGKPRPASLKRVEVDEKRTARACAVIATLYERACG